MIKYGDSHKIIYDITKEYGINDIYYGSEICSEEQTIVNNVRKFNKNCTFYEYYGGNTLYLVGDLAFKNDLSNFPDTFTRFRKNVEGNNTVIRQPFESLSKNNCKETPKIADEGKLGDLKDFGYYNASINIDKRTQFPFKGGETAALERMNEYIWNKKSGKNNNPRKAAITHYKETRNQSIGTEYSSKFSGFLAYGLISPRVIYHEIKKFEKSTGISDINTYWLVFELLWRDFFRFCGMKHGDKIFYEYGPYGECIYQENKNETFEWHVDYKLLHKWIEGQTGYPFIDAAMIELKLTGWMSNRMRQNVASFLIKDMKLDWRLGAEYFEHILIDYDATSNYGNWQYIAGVGWDPSGHQRYFNINKQAWTYDRNGNYVKLWINELNNIDKQYIHKPYELYNCNYIKPCIQLRGPSNFGKKQHRNNGYNYNQKRGYNTYKSYKKQNRNKGNRYNNNNNNNNGYRYRNGQKRMTDFW